MGKKNSAERERDLTRDALIGFMARLNAEGITTMQSDTVNQIIRYSYYLGILDESIEQVGMKRLLEGKDDDE